MVVPLPNPGLLCTPLLRAPHHAGYKNASPASLARELAIMGRNENRHGSQPEADFSAPRNVDPARSGDARGDPGLLLRLESSGALEEKALRCVFGDGFDGAQQQLLQGQARKQVAAAEGTRSTTAAAAAAEASGAPGRAAEKAS